MRRQRIGLLAAVAIAMAVSAWFLAGRGAAPASVAGPTPAPQAATRAEFHPTPVDRSAAPGKPETAATAASFSDYAKAYRGAEDFLALLRQLAPAGNAGNPDALYFMALASRRCTRDYEVFFARV